MIFQVLIVGFRLINVFFQQSWQPVISIHFNLEHESFYCCERHINVCAIALSRNDNGTLEVMSH